MTAQANAVPICSERQVRAPCDRFLKEELLDVQIATNVSLPSQDAGAVRSDCRLTGDGFRTADDRNRGALLTAIGPRDN